MLYESFECLTLLMAVFFGFCMNNPINANRMKLVGLSPGAEWVP